MTLGEQVRDKQKQAGRKRRRSNMEEANATGKANFDSNPNSSQRFEQPRYKNLVPMFIRDLGSESSELRRNAAQALGRIGDKRAVEPLLATLDSDAAFAVRKAAAKAL